MADGLSLGIYRIDGTQQGRAALTILNGLRLYYATTPVMEDERVPLTILIDSKCHSHTAHVSTGDAKHHTSDMTTSLSTYYIMYVYEYMYICVCRVCLCVWGVCAYVRACVRVCVIHTCI